MAQNSKFLILFLGLQFIQPWFALPVLPFRINLETKMSQVSRPLTLVPEEECCIFNEFVSQQSQLGLFRSSTATMANKGFVVQLMDVFIDKQVSIHNTINITSDDQHLHRVKRYLEVNPSKPAPTHRIPSNYSGTGNPEAPAWLERLLARAKERFQQRQRSN